MEEKKKKFESKIGLDKYQYEYCAELIWGGVPVEREWAEETKLFLTMYKGILETYDPIKEKEWKAKVNLLPELQIYQLLSTTIFSNWKHIILTKWEIENSLEFVKNETLKKRLNKKLFRYKFYYKLLKKWQWIKLLIISSL